MVNRDGHKKASSEPQSIWLTAELPVDEENLDDLKRELHQVVFDTLNKRYGRRVPEYNWNAVSAGTAETKKLKIFVRVD